MRVLLVSCYELGHQPLAVASPAAHLLAAGWPLECLDLAVEPFDEDKVRRADFVGISVPMHTAIRLGVRVAARIRAINPGCHVCFYGLYASLNGAYLLSTSGDSVVGGEFETPLVHLVRSLAEGGDGAVDGVRTREHRSGPFLGRQRFLVPERRLLPPLERYARLDAGGALRLVGYVEASRGCAHRCLHCPITPVYEGRLRIVQEQVVREDIRTLVGMGARHITFGDPDFLNGVKHSLQVARNLHQDFPDLTFDMTAKIEHIVEHRSLFAALRDLGCLFVVSAAESLNDAILGHLEKGHTRLDVEEALRITRAAGIALRLSLVPFTPWTTLEDYLDILEFVEDEALVYNLDPVQYSIRLLVPPGSSLLRSPQMAPFLGAFDEETFSYQWTHADPRLAALHQDVSRIVEEAHERREDPARTFHRLRDRALSAAAGRRFAPREAWRPELEARPPRLTESWFC
jgi:radical SAM superfamily enzyme YgiQ (UPF0313 family)